MLNLMTGLIAVIIVTLFVGGLAHSIWAGTGSIAFPLIAVAVLVMIYVDFWQMQRRK